MDTNPFDGMADEEIESMEARLRDATPGPWISYVERRDHESGSSFIQTPASDIELAGATAADQDFIAHARQDLAKLLLEVRRLRKRVA
jgi:hypothetical protein